MRDDDSSVPGEPARRPRPRGGRRPNGTGSLRPVAGRERYWRAELTVRGRVYSATGARPEAAWQRLRDKIAQSRRRPPGAPDPAKVTVAAYARAWLARRELELGRGLEPASWRRHEQALSLHLLPAVGHLPLAGLTAAHLEALYARLLGPPAGLAVETVRKINGTLRLALKRLPRDVGLPNPALERGAAPARAGHGAVPAAPGPEAPPVGRRAARGRPAAGAVAARRARAEPLGGAARPEVDRLGRGPRRAAAPAQPAGRGGRRADARREGAEDGGQPARARARPGADRGAPGAPGAAGGRAPRRPGRRGSTTAWSSARATARRWPRATCCRPSAGCSGWRACRRTTGCTTCATPPCRTCCSRAPASRRPAAPPGTPRRR